MSIQIFLDKIKNAVYGKDVRQAIHDAIKQTYDDASKNGNANMEVSKARGFFNNLNERLDNSDEKLELKADQSFVDSRFATIVSGAPSGTYTDLAALQAAYPNGTEGVMLVLENGHWYYWNNATSTWTDGGIYQATVSDEFPATNLIVNSNFDDTSNWSGQSGSLDAINNELFYKVSSPNAAARIEQQLDVAVVGHKYYVRGDIYPIYNNQTFIRFGNAQTDGFVEANKWNTLKGIVTANQTSRFRFYHDTSKNYVAGDQVKFRRILVIDLTEIFGEGNEPTQEEIESILYKYPYYWFDGTVTLITNKDLYKEAKKQEEEIKITKDTLTQYIDDKFMLTGITFTDGYYIRHSDGLVFQHGSYSATGFVPFDFGGMRFIVSSYFATAAGIAFYKDKSESSYISGIGNHENKDVLSFVCPKETKFIRITCRTSNLSEFYLQLKDLVGTLEKMNNDIKNTSKMELDLEYTIPKVIFGTDNDANRNFAREYVQTVLPEGIVPERVKGLSFDGERELKIQRLRDKDRYDMEDVSTMDFDIPYTLTAEGYREVTGNVILRKAKPSNAKKKRIRYLSIGDSTAQIPLKKLDGSEEGAWNYPSVVKQLSLMDNEDIGDIDVLCVGRLNSQERSFEYNGKTIPIRAMNEAIGGWSAFTWLRHPLNIRLDNKVEYTGSTLYAPAAWDLLGLGTMGGTRSYVAFDGSDAHKKLIARTAAGKYDPDLTEMLWEQMKTIYPSPSFLTWGDTYNNSENTKTEQAVKYLYDNPSNRFFDPKVARGTANESVSYAFSFDKYLNDHRTLEDDGVTRLVVGDTAGRRVTSNYINAWDVCTPTHITIGLGTNDQYQSAITDSEIADDIKLLGKICHEQTGAQIGFLLTRQFGSWYPERWSDVGLTKELGDNDNKRKYNIVKHIMNSYPQDNMSKEDSYFYLPTYQLQGVLDASSTQYQTDLVTGKQLLVPVAETSHPGILSNMAFGYQILSWIYYTLS